jgi:hypothetical protein
VRRILVRRGCPERLELSGLAQDLSSRGLMFDGAIAGTGCRCKGPSPTDCQRERDRNSLIPEEHDLRGLI